MPEGNAKGKVWPVAAPHPMVVTISPQFLTESPGGDATRAARKQAAAAAEQRAADQRARRVAYAQRIAQAAAGLRALQGETREEAAALAAVTRLLDGESQMVREWDARPGAGVLHPDDPLAGWASLVNVADLLARMVVVVAEQTAALGQLSGRWRPCRAGSPAGGCCPVGRDVDGDPEGAHGAGGPWGAREGGDAHAHAQGPQGERDPARRGKAGSSVPPSRPPPRSPVAPNSRHREGGERGASGGGGSRRRRGRVSAPAGGLTMSGLDDYQRRLQRGGSGPAATLRGGEAGEYYAVGEEAARVILETDRSSASSREAAGRPGIRGLGAAAAGRGGAAGGGRGGRAVQHDGAGQGPGQVGGGSQPRRGRGRRRDRGHGWQRIAQEEHEREQGHRSRIVTSRPWNRRSGGHLRRGQGPV